MTDVRHVRLSPHACDRAAEMGVNRRDVRRTVREPDLTYPQDEYAPGALIAQRGRLCVPYYLTDDGVATCLTVLWNTHTETTRENGPPT